MHELDRVDKLKYVYVRPVSFDRRLKAYMQPFCLDRLRLESVQPFCLDPVLCIESIHVDTCQIRPDQGQEVE